MSETLPVYLVHWGAPDWVASSARSILASDIPVSVTVIDNGPEASSVELVLPDDVRVVASGSNLGYAGGANIGLREWLNGSGNYCIVGAHDLHVEPDTLRLLLEVAEQNPEFGILGPKVEGGGKGDRLGQGDGIEEYVWLSGTCLLFTRSCVEHIGLFDELLHSYAEDHEIGLRSNRSGYKVGLVDSARAHGLGSKSSDAQLMWMGNRIVLQARYEGIQAVIPMVASYLRTAFRSAVGMMVLRGRRRSGHRLTVRRYLGATYIGLRKLSAGRWRQPRF